MKNLKATVAHCHEGCIRDIQLFNELAGNEFCMANRRFDVPSTQIQMSLIEEELLELQEAYENDDLLEVVDACCDSIVVITGMLHKLGIDPVLALKEVNASNLSKFCKSEYEADASVKKYLGDSRYSEVHHSKVGDYWVIYGKKTDTDGWKVLKGVNYREPDFKMIMEG